MRHDVLGMIALSLVAGCAGCGGSPSVADSGGASPDAGSDAGTTMPVDAASPPVDAFSATDPYAAARAACIAEINRLRATHGLPAYTAWTGVEACIDQQATSDETNHMAHQAWGMHAGVCDGNGQNECLGAGPDGIVSCLDQMWDERLQPGCSGCDACADAFDPSCPNCDFFGTTTGNVCGHYVNMSARYFTEAACGFSSLGGWDAINFR
jgi:hypothetical protein